MIGDCEPAYFEVADSRHENIRERLHRAVLSLDMRGAGSNLHSESIGMGKDRRRRCRPIRSGVDISHEEKKPVIGRWAVACEEAPARFEVAVSECIDM